MVTQSEETKDIQGLSSTEVIELRKQYGENSFSAAAEFRFFYILKDIVTEPMFILLAIACSLYFILGKSSEGVMMAVAIIIVAAISFYQEVKSTRALKNLAEFTEPRVTVIREGYQAIIQVKELVPGDIALLEEGMKVPADGTIIQSNDLSINESVTSGESLPVEKNDTAEKNQVYQGTTINSGKCIARITATGNKTILGKIGKTVASYQPAKTLLQVQVNRFVKRFALFGFAAFVIIFLVNYLHYHAFVTSLLFALTLAMSAVPEEIPVAFSSFMALGAYKMSRLGIISRQPQVIENLGAVTVLCLDKTGTITENKMQVKTIYEFERDKLTDLTDDLHQPNEVLFISALASEADPFDPMEKAIIEAWHATSSLLKREDFKIIHEYPLEGHPPMMTHVYKQENNYLAAAKGSPERILSICRLDEPSLNKVNETIKRIAKNGYRILGVCKTVCSDTNFPRIQDDFNWKFTGLLALYDPPKKNSAAVLKQIRQAGIAVKILTGDYPETAVNIAGQVGLPGYLNYKTGHDIMELSSDELNQIVKQTSVFARMFPDAKVKVVEALKNSGEIVAMTGDGVNDGPSLKLADIGIAMGKKGTETAKIASDLILTDDNLERIVIAIREGRRIFNNLVKALRYIISIHIPIILTASLPLLLGWKYPNIFTPIHVIFLELIMGPTCSIFFEREPAEESIMNVSPKNRRNNLFTRREIGISVAQGIAITAGILILYARFMITHPIEETRTVVFTTLIASNVFLTFANRSFTETIVYTIRQKNDLAPLLFIISCIFLVLLHLNPFVRNLFELAPVSYTTFLLCLAVAFVCVMWFEVYKAVIRK
jgi:Ca2+-transporting ATPase